MALAILLQVHTRSVLFFSLHSVAYSSESNLRWPTLNYWAKTPLLLGSLEKYCTDYFIETTLPYSSDDELSSYKRTKSIDCPAGPALARERLSSQTKSSSLSSVNGALITDRSDSPSELPSSIEGVESIVVEAAGPLTAPDAVLDRAGAECGMMIDDAAKELSEESTSATLIL
jgi:hypothetical protein